MLERANTGPVVGELRFVAPECVARLREHGDGWLRGHTLEVVPGSPDFLYRRSEMVELRGARYKSKRNDINQLLRTYPSARAEPLRQCDAEAVARLTRLWLSQRGGEQDHSHDEEAFALAAAMQHFDALGLFGVRLMIGDALAGITLGERLPTGVVNVLFEKTDLDVPGASQFIFREFCRLLGDDALINTGDGAGSPSLVRAKESYRPVQLGQNSCCGSGERPLNPRSRRRTRAPTAARARAPLNGQFRAVFLMRGRLQIMPGRLMVPQFSTLHAFAASQCDLLAKAYCE
ncbi:phosphatidylglycerol lysyltransferase domain-containing protein [Nannocystis pusilla]|uniref:phosphatidylglycerol lysyltransferase domain-containing protein n=1 Tax=Nannocystis pusilla TaxID=889268 RepID=UPI003B7BD948